MRVGLGYDVHKLVEGRDLILGGVKIEHTLGLLGHSDADVLVHAIMDALLGAAALGDIGKHFPDTDMKYKGADSMMLMAQCYVGGQRKRDHYRVQRPSRYEGKEACRNLEGGRALLSYHLRTHRRLYERDV